MVDDSCYNNPILFPNQQITTEVKGYNTLVSFLQVTLVLLCIQRCSRGTAFIKISPPGLDGISGDILMNAVPLEHL